MPNDLGLIGLGVMGASIAQNFADKGWNIVVFNRTAEKTQKFLEKFRHKNISGETHLETFVKNLKKPRKILLMVKAGEGVDAMIKKLVPFLEKDDIIADLGNSHYKETIERATKLQPKGIQYIGCGISGGEEGARKGPSLMPGGDKKACKALMPFLKSIAAKDFGGKPCVAYIGPDGSGHFVKMVHNGIEYGLMQILAEIYDILRSAYQLPAPKIAEIFEKWNKTRLNSYLLAIAAEILRKKDPLIKGFLIDAILDKAGGKGTGAWTVIDAAGKAVAVPTISAAVDSRYISGEKAIRSQLAKKFPKISLKKSLTPKDLTMLGNALFAANMLTYIQGYALIAAASKEYAWDINLSEVTRIWQGGCIIRAKILETFHRAYTKNANLLLEPSLTSAIKDLKSLVSKTIENNIPAPALTSTLQYFFSMTTKNLPANLIQALRDYFGAHTYERIDREGIFHTQW